MKTRKLLAAAMAVALVCPQSARATTFKPQQTAQPGSAPQGVNYQGRLESNGVPVTGSHFITFKLFDALSAGNLIWTSPTQSVTFTTGLFNTVIPIPLTALIGGTPVFVEVNIDGTTLSPREALQSVPYAMVAKSVEGTLDVSSGSLNIVPAPTSGQTTSIYVSSATGFVGIGTTSPATKLHMSSGTLTIDGTATTSITANRAINSGDHYEISGSTVLTRGSDGTNVFVGQNAGQNELGSNKLYIANTNTASPIVYGDFTTGAVGLGTNSPTTTNSAARAVRLDVAGGGVNLPNNTDVNFKSSGGTSASALNVDGTNNVNVGDNGNVFSGSVLVNLAGSTRLTVNRLGMVTVPAQVGVGSGANPANTLDVNGGAIIRSSITVTQVAAPAVSAANTGSLYFDSTLKHFMVSENGGGYQPLTSAGGSETFTSSMTILSSLGVGAGNLQNGTLVVRSTSTTAGNSVAEFLNNAGGSVWRVQQDGKVGVGTASPSTLMHIFGNGATASIDTSGAANPAVIFKESGVNKGYLFDCESAACATATSVLKLNIDGSVSGGITIDGSNNVGIGAAALTTANSSARAVKLDITGGGVNLPNNTDVNFKSSGGTSASALNVDASNNVNVGDNANLFGAAVQLNAGGGARETINKNGMVTIGAQLAVGSSANPANTLDVTGGMIIRSSGTFAGIAAPPVSAAGNGSIYFDSTAHKFEVSENGGAYYALIPAGMVSFFNLAACPAGWSALDGVSASPDARGRYVVGLPGGGTLAGTAGTALSNLENRPVGQHNHTITDPGHGHTITDPGHAHAITDPGHTHNVGTSGTSGAGAFIMEATAGGTNIATANSTTGITVNSNTTGITVNSGTTGVTVNNSGTVAGTNAPYVQFLLCVKN